MGSRVGRLWWPLLATGLTWGAFLVLAPLLKAPTLAPELAERLAGGVRLALFPVAVVLAQMASVQFRQLGAGAPSGRSYRVARRALADTMVYTVAFLPMLLALSTELPPAWLGCLVLLVILFVTGRLLFWIGSLNDARLAASGTAVTLNVVLGMLAYLLLQVTS